MTQQIIVTGAGGMLGRAVVKAAHARDLNVVGIGGRIQIDVGFIDSVRAVLSRHTDPIVINCAGIVPPMASEGWRPALLQQAMWRANAYGPHHLSASAGRLIHVSTDCVFDGAIQDGEYTEASEPSAVGDYAESKLAGEVTQPPHLTIRGSFIGLGRRGLVRWILDQPEEGHIFGYQDWVWNGAYVNDFADAVVDLALKPSMTGLVHLAGPEVLTKGQLVEWLAGMLRPDITVEQGDGGHRRMVLASTRIAPILTPWYVMLGRLHDDYGRHPTGS